MKSATPAARSCSADSGLPATITGVVASQRLQLAAQFRGQLKIFRIGTAKHDEVRIDGRNLIGI